MKLAISYLLFFLGVTFVYSGCLSAKKLKQANSNYGRLDSSYRQLQVKYSDYRDSLYRLNNHLFQLNQNAVDLNNKITVLNERLNGPKPIFNNGSYLPNFTFPPPKPSTMADIPSVFFKKCVNFSDVAEKLLDALNKCGYDRRSFFSCPNGFALATQLEHINDDGTSKPENDRWDINENTKKIDGFVDYLHDVLWPSRPGYWRTMVFIVTDQPFNTSSNTPKEPEVRNWTDAGYSSLPNKLRETKVNGNFIYTVLVYEVKKLPNGELRTISTSRISAINHLKKSLLYSKLQS